MKKHLPNLLTLLNLFCGCLGILSCFTTRMWQVSGHTLFASDLVPVFMGIALAADFADGFLARLLNAKSPLGAQLDSLADMVTFGVLPGFMLLKIFGSITVYDDPIFGQYFKLVALLYTMAACYRLAKFTIDERQTENFLGLATPAGAIFVLGLYKKLFPDAFNIPFIYDAFSLVIITFGLSYLMIGEIPFFSMKGNPLSWKENKFRVLFLVFCLPQPFVFGWLGLSTIIGTYIFFSVLQNIMEKKAIA